jgi:hypothetical protein
MFGAYSANLLAQLTNAVFDTPDYAYYIVHIIVEAAHSSGCALDCSLKHTPAFILHPEALPQDAQIFLRAL